MKTCRWLVVSVGVLVSVTAPAVERVSEAPPAARPKRPWAASKVQLPQHADGRIVRQVRTENLSVRLDMTDQILAVHAPKSQTFRLPGAFEPGDTVTVTSDRAALVRDKQTIATLAQGQLLAVREISGAWLSVAAPVSGKPQSGWVQAKDVKFTSPEPLLEPTIPDLGGGPVSAAVLLQKAKQFDDGLYAVVELAAQDGAGKFAGKAALLAALAERISTAGAPPADDGARVLFSAARLGGVAVKLPAPLAPAVEAHLTAFLAAPDRAKPLGFYTWSDRLSAIFRQDRMLQSPIESPDAVERLAAALRADDSARATYEAYLALLGRLTNPLLGDDLRGALAGAAGRAVSIFPASRSHETELVKRLYGDREIPEGFSLMDELVARIKAGKIDLTPRSDSGWYDYQTWSLEPLVTFDKTHEAGHLKADDRYRQLLVELFKGALALARETHVKQLEVPPAAERDEAAKPKPQVWLHPDLSVEPLATVYLRRAKSYRFVRDVLEQTFGGEALAKLHRLTAKGPVEPTLADELAAMESLFFGAYLTSLAQLGLAPAADAGAGSGDAAADARRFLDWAANLDHDADISQDARMMVPVFYDAQRKKTKVWALLGWTLQGVGFDFATAPKAMVFDREGHEVASDQVVLHFAGQWTAMPYPVVAELYVDELLDREEFRRHCDQYRTRSAILRNLK